MAASPRSNFCARPSPTQGITTRPAWSTYCQHFVRASGLTLVNPSEKSPTTSYRGGMAQPPFLSMKPYLPAFQAAASPFENSRAPQKRPGKALSPRSSRYTETSPPAFPHSAACPARASSRPSPRRSQSERSVLSTRPSRSMISWLQPSPRSTSAMPRSKSLRP